MNLSDKLNRRTMLKTAAAASMTLMVDDVLAAGLFPDALGISNRHCGLDDHNGIRIRFHDQLDYIFHSSRVEMLSNYSI